VARTRRHRPLGTPRRRSHRKDGRGRHPRRCIPRLRRSHRRRYKAGCRCTRNPPRQALPHTADPGGSRSRRYTRGAARTRAHKPPRSTARLPRCMVPLRIAPRTVLVCRNRHLARMRLVAGRWAGGHRALSAAELPHPCIHLPREPDNTATMRSWMRRCATAVPVVPPLTTAPTGRFCLVEAALAHHLTGASGPRHRDPLPGVPRPRRGSVPFLEIRHDRGTGAKTARGTCGRNTQLPRTVFSPALHPGHSVHDARVICGRAASERQGPAAIY